MERPARRFELADLPMYLGYVVSVVTASAGIVIVSGLVLDRGIPPQFRITFGIVFILMGIYRFVLTRAKIQQWRTEDDTDGS